MAENNIGTQTLEKTVDAALNDNGVLPMNLSAIDNFPETINKPAALVARERHPLELFYDVPVTLVFEVGRIDISIKELMELKEGSMIDLRQISVDSIDIRIDDKIIAYGEAIGLKHIYGIRFGELELFCPLDDVALGDAGDWKNQEGGQ